MPGGFHHAAHGVRSVTVLEPSLDLSAEVVDGILKHSKGKTGPIFARGAGLTAMTREAQVVRAADLYAYACHDLEDAYLLGLLTPAALPSGVASGLGTLPDGVRSRLVSATLSASLRDGELALEPDVESALGALRGFLYERLYESGRIAGQTAFVRGAIETLWAAALADGCSPGQFLDDVATMTDRQALERWRRLRRPVRAWSWLVA